VTRSSARPKCGHGPFLLGGGGWYFTTIDPEGASSDTDGRFGFHAGGGLELALSDYWTLSGSYRYLWLEEFRTRLATLEEAEFDDSGHMIVGSLNYHF
jgi:opacity protein-like surface antigen